jgi:hypothetical protein
MTATPGEAPRRLAPTAGRPSTSRRAAEQALEPAHVRREPTTAAPTRRIG